MSAATILDEAIQLVTRDWCQYAQAKNPSGKTVAAWSPDACSWCLTGALHRARDNSDGVGFVEAYNLVADIIARQEGEDIPIALWNDKRERTKAEVLAVLVTARLAV
jgi:hypothetical protein